MSHPAGGAEIQLLHPARARILFVITDLEVGGVPLHLLRLATSLHETGWRVTVVSLKPPGAVGDRMRSAGVNVQSCDAQAPWDWRAIDRLAGIIGDLAPDIVHAFLFHANLAARGAALLSGFRRSRLICEIQTVETERNWHLWVDRLTHRLCRCTIGNSPSVVEHLHRRAGISRARLRCVPGGADLERFADAEPMSRDQLGVPAGVPLLIWVGRMDPIKGLDTLLAAVDRLRRHQPVQLLLVGDGPIRAEVEADRAQRGLHDCVHLLGLRDDVPRLLATADAFVFPSRTEGFPNAILEAFAARVPVVATAAPGTRDLVTDGKTGRMSAVDDPVGLADAIQRTLRDRDAAQAMAQQARRLVEQDFTRQRCYERYLDLYREVLGDVPA